MVALFVALLPHHFYDWWWISDENFDCVRHAMMWSWHRRHAIELKWFDSGGMNERCRCALYLSYVTKRPKFVPPYKERGDTIWIPGIKHGSLLGVYWSKWQTWLTSSILSSVMEPACDLNIWVKSVMLFLVDHVSPVTRKCRTARWSNWLPAWYSLRGWWEEDVSNV